MTAWTRLQPEGGGAGFSPPPPSPPTMLDTVFTIVYSHGVAKDKEKQ